MKSYRHFLVLSSGYCGSLWLGAALDRFPEISCSSSRLYGLSVPHNSGLDLSAVDPYLIGKLVQMQSVPTPSAVFALCAQHKPGAIALGEVHGWRVKTLHETLPEHPTLAHLVRHPVVLLERIVQEEIHRYRHFPRVRTFMTDKLDLLLQTHSLLLNGLNYDIGQQERSLPFLWGVHRLHTVLQEASGRPDIPLWGFERLLNDRSHFSDFVSALTDGAVDADPTVLDSLFAHTEQQQLGRFRSSGLDSHTDPASVWNGWLPQERALVHRLFDVFDPATLYAPVGYTFDFLTSDGVA